MIRIFANVAFVMSHFVVNAYPTLKSPHQRVISTCINTAYVTIPFAELIGDVKETKVFLQRPVSLRNKYYGLRHGESFANVEGIISSDFKVGSTIHGLTPTGTVQARRAATSLIDTIGRENLEHMILISSPFTRARETAEETLQAMQAIMEFEHAPFTVSSDYTNEPRNANDWLVHLDRVRNAAVEIRDELRERYFGELDALPLIYYNRVWPIDAIDADNTRDGVESVNQVIQRVSGLISELEDRHSGKHIVLTSHADTLQITQTYLANGDARKFAQYRFKNGEVRDMETLPAPVPMIYK